MPCRQPSRLPEIRRPGRRLIFHRGPSTTDARQGEIPVPQFGCTHRYGIPLGFRRDDSGERPHRVRVPSASAVESSSARNAPAGSPRSHSRPRSRKSASPPSVSTTPEWRYKVGKVKWRLGPMSQLHRKESFARSSLSPRSQCQSRHRLACFSAAGDNAGDTPPWRTPAQSIGGFESRRNAHHAICRCPSRSKARASLRNSPHLANVG